MLFTLNPIDIAEGYGEGILPLAEAKAHLGVLADDDDALIKMLRDAAIDAVEKYCNIRLAETTGIVARFEGFGSRMRAGIGPAASVLVTGVSYVDSAGEAADIEAGGWRLDVLGNLLPALNTAWPTSYGPVTVTFTAGYTDDNRPRGLVHAAKMMLAHLFMQREAVITGTISGEAPFGFRFLCDQYRLPVI